MRILTHAVLGRTGIPVHRLGLSASYLPGRATIHGADLGPHGRAADTREAAPAARHRLHRRLPVPRRDEAEGAPGEGPRRSPAAPGGPGPRHRGAEEDIFPQLRAHDPGVVAYTATRWTALLRRPPGWPKEGRVPTAGECYRFVLSSPHVDVCVTAPRNVREREQNLAALEQGPLDEDEMAFLRRFGDAVHAQRRWFM